MVTGMGSNFDLVATDVIARAGVLHTLHGDIPTPAFMPVATQGSVKALDPPDLTALGAKVILSNTYHLYLRPGVQTIASLGGLQRFMSWPGPILTDSGGFQGFSLEHLREFNEDGIIFKSHLDGSLHQFTPENVIEYQQHLGSDLIMPLDVCVASNSRREDVEQAVERTFRWANRSLDVHTSKEQSLFGIVQGGLFDDLRSRSVSQITGMGFSGYAIGGLSVGESKADMYQVVESTARLLPQDNPRYLMGVGAPEDLIDCVASGIDMFDCVLPTRIARNGALFVNNGRVNINTASFRKIDNPIDESCDCYTCLNYSAAYINHLYRSKELLAYRLGTVHNLRFIIRLMDEMRAAILSGRFNEYRGDFHKRFVPTNEKVRSEQQRKWRQAKVTGYEDQN